MHFRLNRRNLIRRAGILSAAGLGPLVTGCDGAPTGRRETKFRVTGNSMAPTFVGSHSELGCDRCGIIVQVPRDSAAAENEDPAASETTPWTCWHCGNRNRSPTPPTRPGDVVEISGGVPGSPLGALNRTGLPDLALGDVVAVDWGNAIRLKRIAGLPGDTITTDGLWLHNERLPVHCRFPPQHRVTIPVDVDALRTDSRWRPPSTSDQDAGDSWPASRRWTRRQNQWRSPAADAPSGQRSRSAWLVYHHVNVHDRDRPSPVYDDWPGNIELARRFLPARDLRISLTLVAPNACTIETAIWSAAGVWRQSIRADLFDRIQHTPDCGASVLSETDDQIPVSATSPIAIRVIDGPCRISGIRVDRYVEYRLRPQDDSSVYPLTLDDGQCFVVGDNVPVSIDSRSAGPIPVAQIRGFAIAR